MGHENTALKSWLPPSGTIRRKIILKKLKRGLERRGMSREEVYKGLHQLATTPRVLVARWNIHDFRDEQSHVNNDIVEHEKWPLPKQVERDKIIDDDDDNDNDDDDVEAHDEKLSESKFSKIYERDENDISDRILQKSKTPELLDENVGDYAPFRVKTTRKAITLKLNSHDIQKNDDKTSTKQQMGLSTEIRIADSSVSDENENLNDVNMSHCCSPFVRKIRDNDDEYSVKDAISKKKPKIVEDLTCVEGTLLSREALINSCRGIIAKSSSNDEKTTNDRSNVESKINHNAEKIINTRNNSTKKKSRSRIVPVVRKKLRLRRKFRQLFGNDLTLSELDEEDNIIDRFVRARIKKIPKINSSDTISKLDDENLNDTFVKQPSNFHDSTEKSLSRDTQTTSKREKNQPNKIDNNYVSEKTPSTLLSMPLLDVSSRVTVFSDNENFLENLPDSSTSSNDNVSRQADYSSLKDEKNIVNDDESKIIASPLNIELSNDHTTISREKIYPTCDNNLTTPTSTTGYFPLVSPQPKSEDCEEIIEIIEIPDQDFTRLLGMEVLSDNCSITMRGNTISISENSKHDMSVITNGDISKISKVQENESIIIDYKENVISDKTTDELLIACNCKDLETDAISSDVETIAVIPREIIDLALESKEDIVKVEKKSENFPESEIEEISKKEDESMAGTEEIEEPREIIDLSPEFKEDDVEVFKKSDNLPKREIEEITKEKDTSMAEAKKIDDILAVSKIPPCPPAVTLSVPKIRVLHHRELGSRWCPTPLNNEASSSGQETSGESYDSSSSHNSPISTLQQQQQQQRQQQQQQQQPKQQQQLLLPRDPGTNTQQQQSPQPSSLDYLKMLFSNSNPPSVTTRNISVDMSASTSARQTSSRNDTSLPCPVATNYQQQTILPAARLPVYSTTSSNFAANSLLGTIFRLLLSLDWCIERNKNVSNAHDALELQKEFNTDKPLLWAELRKFGVELGTNNIQLIVSYIVRYYENLMERPEDRVLNIDKVLNVISLEHLPNHQFPAEQYWTSIYHNNCPTLQSSQRPDPPPPPYPRVNSYVIGNLPPFYVPAQRVDPSNRERRVSTDRSSSWSSASSSSTASTIQRPVPTLPMATTLFSPRQMAILMDQIAIYNYYLKIIPQQQSALNARRTRKKKKRTRDGGSSNSRTRLLATTEISSTTTTTTTTRTTTTTVENLANYGMINDAFLRTCLEEPISDNNETRDIIFIDSAPFSNPAISDDPALSGDPAPSEDPAISDDPAPSEDPALSGDPAPSEDPATSGDPAPSEDPATSGDSAPSEDPATCGDPATSGDKLEDDCDDDLNENKQSPSTDVSRNIVRVADVLQELAVLSSHNSGKISSISSSNNNKNKKRNEATKTPVRTPMTPGGSSIAVSKFENKEAVEMLKSANKMSHTTGEDKTEIEKINEESSEANLSYVKLPIDETNDVEVIEATTFKSDVPVITIDDCETIDGNNETLPPVDVNRPNFSILDVKSISKDVFNSMGESNSNSSSGDASEMALASLSSEQTTSDARKNEPRDTNENEGRNAYETIMAKLESGECLRCGEPSSLVCEQCYEAPYCSSDCHDVHWTEHHHFTCKPLSAEARAQIESRDSPNENAPSPRG